ncbi:MAG: hypothetical protein KGZ87_05290 [Bacteroidetes bacterium]|nr:hypothetical protein [Bacteroidota bacterium]
MKLVLERTYYAQATHGTLYADGKAVCDTLELPWRFNKRQVSCIPEGSYRIKKRFSAKYKWHLEVLKVPGRSGILIHPANDAQKELQGCIAPVSYLSGMGKGVYSRKALNKLLELLEGVLTTKETVVLEVVCKK